VERDPRELGALDQWVEIRRRKLLFSIGVPVDVVKTQPSDL